MKIFQCQCCGQVLHFENTACLRCGRTIGYLPDSDEMIAVEPEGALWYRASPEGGPADAARWRFCANWERSACNWMVAADPEAEPTDQFCAACCHNRTVPDLSDAVNLSRWQKIEAAKRRLFHTLRALKLPLPVPGDGHAEPLVFDFLADSPDGPRVLTGHAEGVVTISLTEADDAVREKMRTEMGEAYRTLLGHFRHEIGHYYWDLLLRDGPGLEDFRALFGDERADYAESMQRHYAQGAPAGWEANFVSSYATMHPWEDWAETWAHYLHMVDTLQTAAAFGMTIDAGVEEEGLATEIDFDPMRVRRFGRLLAAWTPLTVAMNAMNRAMGQPDLYPFALTPPVEEKLAFVHDLVRGSLSRPLQQAA